jgi:hypothetical protein
VQVLILTTGLRFSTTMEFGNEVILSITALIAKEEA